MKAKHLSLAVAALLAAGALWFAWSAWRTQASPQSRMIVGLKTSPGQELSLGSPAKPGQMRNAPARLAPPDPNRRFTDFTPEQRVQFARQGHGPGG